jgi:inosine-uridine nucleoside N-ribohydrolase
MHVAVELSGDYTAGATVVRPAAADRPANAQVCLDVDADRAIDLFLSRLGA